MYAVYKQAHPPTGLEFALACNFFSTAQRNLVAAGSSQLYVYRLNHDCEPLVKGERNGEGKGHKEKLELVASFTFFGNVMSMASVQLAGAKRDALLLSFKDAKLSVVEYDPGTHDLKTLSLHYFEEPELRDGFVQNVHIPRVRVDPDGRCAVMLIYGTRLVVLPFRRDTLTDEHEGLVGEGQKSSFLPSYIIDVRELDEKLLNIIDMQFLHGYYEPTLLILYEPNQTWPGRVAVRQDTCSIVAISLNIMQKVHPVIWSLSNLPFDCTQALAVPKPIGGVVIFAVNSLLYLNQSVPPYGVALNSLTNGTTVFPLRIQDGVKMTLDCAQATFISYDKMVISLKGGEIYVLTLITDGMRSVRSFHFDKAAASVLTTCMVALEPGYLFLGSRLGNSLLLKYTEKLQEAPAGAARDPPERQEEPPQKKKRPEASGPWAGAKAAPQDEVDEIEVYGSEAQSGTQLATYSFEVCDSILNIGPCANAAMGEPAFLSEEFQNHPEPDLELVLCSGYGKNGALSVLQKSIRPQVVTTFELPGCYDMWTVIAPQKKEEAAEGAAPGDDAEKEPAAADSADEDAGKRHGFLILSREDSTMILQTGQEIMELDTSGFATQGPTVFAGNIGDNRYIVQVSPLGIRLLEGVNQLHFIPVDLGAPIVHCAVADPFVVILSAEGHVSMFVLKSDSYGGRTHRLSLQKPQLHHQSKVLALCLYRDVSGMFTTESRAAGAREELPGRGQAEAETLIQDIGDTVDDEEEMLYGDSGALFSPVKEEPRRGSCPSAERDPHQNRPEPTHWCVLVRESGTMEIYQLPEWRLVFLVKNFPMGQRVLVDSSFGQPVAAPGAAPGAAAAAPGAGAPGAGAPAEARKEEPGRQGDLPLVKEVLLVGLGHRRGRPYLLVSTWSRSRPQPEPQPGPERGRGRSGAGGMRPRGALWGAVGRRALSAGGAPAPPQPFEAIPSLGRGRWLNLLRLWRRGGSQRFHLRMQDAFRSLGPVYRERVGTYDCVNVLLPRDAAQLFRAEGDFPRRMGIEAWSAHRRLRNHKCGLFLLNGPSWRSDRLALNPALLSPAGARRFLPLLDAVARDFAAALGRRLRQSPGGTVTIDPHPLLFRFTLEASSYALYGERLGLLGGGAAPGGAQRFLGALEAMLRTTPPLLFLPPPVLRLLPPPLWQEHLRAWDTIFQHADESIQRIYRAFCRGGAGAGGGAGGGLLAQLLLQARLPLDSIKANVTEFTAGGVDTTAVPLLFTLFELGRNPRVQRALRDELRAAGEGPGPHPQALLGSLPLLKAAIKETLRLYPVGVTVQRYPARDVVLHNYRVPAGTLCQVGLYAMGRSPAVFPHPERYDPWRWLGNGDNSFKALAFGFGARQCIGRRLAEAEMMLFLIHVLRNFSIEAVSTEDIPTVFRFILMPETSPLLTFRSLN
ncbi:cleavage and polyadenylation specificity factor subunit 1 [Strigops habroptila]|uniref:cleavage and polyadenylation specificity factor subunit 1 n=1 Tax=Strigops habroptila TaxID=2489341 RepID=UPI0011CF4D29|nr:cleavage and polyadenylation specificity factor subunit 1 [Strigops habroptila]